MTASTPLNCLLSNPLHSFSDTKDRLQPVNGLCPSSKYYFCTFEAAINTNLLLSFFLSFCSKRSKQAVCAFHLSPQFKYEFFHIYFTSSSDSSREGHDELNKLTSLPMCGFIAQLAEHRTGIRGVHGTRIPLKLWIVFKFFFFPISYIGKFTAMIILHIHNFLCWKFVNTIQNMFLTKPHKILPFSKRKTS